MESAFLLFFSPRTFSRAEIILGGAPAGKGILMKKQRGPKGGERARDERVQLKSVCQKKLIKDAALHGIHYDATLI